MVADGTTSAYLRLVTGVLHTLSSVRCIWVCQGGRGGRASSPLCMSFAESILGFVGASVVVFMFVAVAVAEERQHGNVCLFVYLGTTEREGAKRFP